MKIVATLLLLISIGLGVLAYKQGAVIGQQRQQIQQLNEKLESVSKTTALELQEKCATQAREEFKLYGWDKQEMASVSNHYNTKLNKCFMEVENTDTKSAHGQFISSKTVSDAFEGKVYGSYMWSTRPNKKYWEVPPLQCKVTLPSGEEKICHSEDEFNVLVKQYME